MFVIAKHEVFRRLARSEAEVAVRIRRSSVFHQILRNSWGLRELLVRRNRRGRAKIACTHVNRRISGAYDEFSDRLREQANKGYE
jgi:hypothetical protein